MKIEDRKDEQLELESACADMAGAIAECLPEGTAFALMMADFGAEGNAAYCSNANREDMISLLRETADRIEGVNN